MRRTPPPVLLASILSLLVAGTATGLHRATHGDVATIDAAAEPPHNAGVHGDVDPSTTSTTAPAAVEPAPVSPVPDLATPPAPAPVPLDPAPPTGRIPIGKGMWLYQLSQTDGAPAVVDRARATGLTHLYLRVGSSKKGFYGQAELNELLPAAHAAGLKVIGWDFVYLFDPAADADRSAAEIAYVTPDGHRMDGFSADIETASEGVNLTAEGAAVYGARLRTLVGPGYPLIATVPRPSPKRWFPFAEVTQAFDAIAPMVYWQNRDPAADVAGALADLAPLGKPVLPVGQAYNGADEGGPDLDPPRAALAAFMSTALAKGALGVSFWVWHHTTAEQWSAIDHAQSWELVAGEPKSAGQVRFLQRVLTHLGHHTDQDGSLGPATRSALSGAQTTLGLPPTGMLDEPTITAILRP